ncbi:MAG: hypothetical protein NTU61_04710 [Candidatus Altiarchaeota archaeon]|nr:hypothetical protein [Candidatus Altiarchaeota archaeon]
MVFGFSSKCRTTSKALLPLLLIALLALNASAQQTVNLTGLQIALKTLPYIESAPLSDGLLSYTQHCEGSKCEYVGSSYKQSRAWLVLAYVQLYHATGDKNYVVKAREAMNQLLTDCNPVDDAECYYLGVQAEAAYGITGDDRYLGYLREIDPRLIPLGGSSEDEMLKAIAARELALAYKHKVFNEPVQIISALNVLLQGTGSMEPLIVHDGVELKKSSCWTYLAFTEFYRTIDGMGDGATLFYGVNVSYAKPSVLSPPKKFFDEFDFETLPSEIRFHTLSLTQLEPCAEVALDLYDFTGDERYKNQTVSMLTTFLNQNWDSEYSKKYVGDNSFTSQSCRSGADGITCYRNNKVFTDNAYAVYLFSRMKDQVFTVQTGVPVNYVDTPQVDSSYPTTTTSLKETTVTTIPPAGPSGGSDWIVPALIMVIAIAVIVIYLKSTKSSDGKRSSKK